MGQLYHEGSGIFKLFRLQLSHFIFSASKGLSDTSDKEKVQQHRKMSRKLTDPSYYWPLISSAITNEMQLPLYCWTEDAFWCLCIYNYIPVRGRIKGTGIVTVYVLQHRALSGGHVFPFDVWYMPWDQGMYISLMFDTCTSHHKCLKGSCHSI